MLSRREYEKKLRQEQEAAAHVFQDFINAFQDSSVVPNKTFVKSGVLNPDKNEENPIAGQLYNPKPLIKPPSHLKKAIECAKILKENRLEKTKRLEKPKSNLEMLKEELKLRHSERDERDRLKEELASAPPALSYFEGGDPNSTNLFVANLAAKVTENDLMRDFGAYGPLASVKIMWPRGEERFRGTNSNCGFVAFMSRKDAERALQQLKHRTDMRVGWGKSVELPSHPVYVPDELLKLYLPPPDSGLPFNAQPLKKHDENADSNDVLFDSAVKVTIPLNKKALMLLNRTVEFVVKEGPMFEAMVMNKEIANPDFRFLFDYKSPLHSYYRWKLFSILNGDGQKSWSMRPFRMFKGGSIWLPPSAPNYSNGMPEHLLKNTSQEDVKLSKNQCERLVVLIQNLTLTRRGIAEAMAFCLNRTSAIRDSLDLIVESLSGDATTVQGRLARLYLLADVLSNCKMKRIDVGGLQGETLTEVFRKTGRVLDSLKYDADRENFRSRVMKVLRQLQWLNVFSVDYMKQLEAIFHENRDSCDEGQSSGDEPLDGASLLKRSLKNNVDDDAVTVNTELVRRETNSFAYFVPSKWDAVDPEEVQSQAMSTEKLFHLEMEKELEKLKAKKDGATVKDEDARPKRQMKDDEDIRAKKCCDGRKRHKSRR